MTRFIEVDAYGEKRSINVDRIDHFYAFSTSTCMIVVNTFSTYVDESYEEVKQKISAANRI